MSRDAHRKFSLLSLNRIPRDHIQIDQIVNNNEERATAATYGFCAPLRDHESAKAAPTARTMRRRMMHSTKMFAEIVGSSSDFTDGGYRRLTRVAFMRSSRMLRQ